jgi:hypothetical protein
MGQEVLYKANDNESALIKMHLVNINRLRADIEKLSSELNIAASSLSLVHIGAYNRNIVDKIKSNELGAEDMLGVINKPCPPMFNSDGSSNIIFDTNTNIVSIVCS